MTKYYCDVCGKEIWKLTDGCTVTITKRHDDTENKMTIFKTSKEIMLCPECEYKLKVFLKIPGEEFLDG